MTFGEMATLTKRFNQIKRGSPELKEKRLRTLAKDIEDAYSERGLFYDMSAYLLYKSIKEEMA